MNKIAWHTKQNREIDTNVAARMDCMQYSVEIYPKEGKHCSRKRTLCPNSSLSVRVVPGATTQAGAHLPPISLCSRWPASDRCSHSIVQRTQSSRARRTDSIARGSRYDRRVEPRVPLSGNVVAKPLLFNVGMHTRRK